MNPHEIILRPVVTEKSASAGDAGNVVTLAVNPRANKHQIREAVRVLFNVQVLAVRTLRVRRKRKRTPKRRFGTRPEWKKALLTLPEGQSIEFIEGV